MLGLPKRNLFTTCAVVCCSALLVLSHSNAAADEVLRWRVQPGQEFKVETTQDMTQKVEAGAFSQEVPVKMNISVDWRVLEAREGSFVVGQTIDHLRINVDSPMMRVDYDSKEEGEADSSPIVQMIKPLIGVEVKQTMTDRGEITDLEIPEEVTRNIQPAPGMPAMTPEMLKEMMGQAVVQLPEEPVRRGMTWTTSGPTNLAGLSGATETTFRYEGTEEIDGRTLHKIQASTQLRLDEIPPGMGELDIESHQSEGTLYFDNERGFLTRADFTQDVQLRLTAQGQQMRQHVKSRSQMRISEK